MSIVVPLFSGSSGNSYYVGTKESGILIDAGRTAKQLTEMLRTCEIDPLAIQGVFVTHEHSDHISGLRVFCKKYSIPVFATAGTVEAMESMGVLEGSFDTYILEKDLQIGDMSVNYFSTSHDCAQSCGYRIKTSDGKILTIATDLGFLSEEVKENILGSDFLIIESNHDEGMLKAGGYPYTLKRRILSDRGHLSNNTCAAYLPAVQKSGIKKILLAHLSSENNTPDIAYQTSLCALTMEGLVKDNDFTLAVAPKANLKGTNINF